MNTQVKGRVNNENPKSKLNCDTFLQYLNDNNNITLIEYNNLVWRYIYHIIREIIMRNHSKQKRNKNNI